jgi:iron complex outermembrane receptor protein
MKGYVLKLLYGNAFRAPAFLELYSSAGGNTDLDPETIDNYEIGFGAEFTHNFNSRITLYHRERKDLIIPSSDTAPWDWVNQGSSRDQGFELEMRYDFERGTYIAGNYNFRDWKTGEPPAPKHSGKVMANIRLSRFLNFYADCQFTDEWHRWVSGDDRDKMSGYGIVNATLITKKFLKGYEGLELRGSVYNLFDKDYTTFTGPDIPNDLPMPGINYLLEIKYAF